MSLSPKDPMRPIPVPKQARVTEGKVTLAGGTRLYYWDTGGKGEPIVLCHPASGSAMIWGYQQPVFAKAGYRVISYSRRNFWKSDKVDPKNPGAASEDLRQVVEFLGIDRFHAVASAAGGSVASDFATSYPERLHTLTISSNPCGIRTGYISNSWLTIRPEGWEDLPREFWEVGPSYRAVNPKGLKAWMTLEHKSGGHGHRQKQVNNLSEKHLEKRKIPTLLMTGEQDLATPPVIQRMVARHVPDCEVVIASESGHSLYWERPDLFNKAVLDFLKRRGPKAAKKKRVKKKR